MILIDLKEITNNLDNRRIPLNSTQRASKSTNPVYPYIGANNIMGYVDEYIFDEKILCVAEDGGSWGYQENCAKIYNQKVWVNNHAHVLTARENLVLEYLMYYLNYADLSLYINGATRGKLTKTSLNSIKIPLPPLDQQIKIAAILDAVDAYRQKTKTLIKKYDELVPSLFIDMFGDPVTNPKGYIKSTVGEECNVKGGKRVPKGQKLIKEKTNHPYIKAQNIKNGFINEEKLEYLTDEIAEKLKRYIVNHDDVCITVVGINIGDIGIVPKSLHLANLTENANKLLIKNKDKLDGTYLAFYMMSDFVQRQVSKRTMAVGVPKLALFRIQQIELLVPPIEIQRKFRTNLDSIEAQKAQAQESLEQAENLFNSLLQKAFKGELI